VEVQVRVGNHADVAVLGQRILKRELDRVARMHANRRRNFLPLPEKRGPAIGIELRLQRDGRNAVDAVDFRNRVEHRNAAHGRRRRRCRMRNARRTAAAAARCDTEREKCRRGGKSQVTHGIL
jgi:hypothetical protein